MSPWNGTGPTTLTVTTREPMLVVGASAGGTGADLDVLTDAHGFPYLDQSQLMKRLRDAAVRVVAADPARLAVPAVEMFGAPRSIVTAGRLLQAGPARVDRQIRIDGAVVWRALEGDLAGQRRLTRLHTAMLTTLAAATRTGRDGAPASGTLREVRAVRAGVTLTADLIWRATPTSEHIRVLALAVLALRQIGRGGGDGFGHVDAALDGDRSATIAAAKELLS